MGDNLALSDNQDIIDQHEEMVKKTGESAERLYRKSVTKKAEKMDAMKEPRPKKTKVDWQPKQNVRDYGAIWRAGITY